MVSVKKRGALGVDGGVTVMRWNGGTCDDNDDDDNTILSSLWERLG